jgi:hypothetical protein
MSRQTSLQQQLSHHATRIGIFAALALSAVACAKDVPTGAQPCPCADGYVCCQSGVCAQGQDACDEATSALSAKAAGRWTGYIENYNGLTSGADTLALSFTVADDGTFQGTAKLGDAAPPAPPTDPKVPWPPGIRASGLSAGTAVPVEGFAYTAHTLNWEARRLKFAIYFEEPWKPWCELQTPRSAGYQTLPDGGTSSMLNWICTPPGLYVAEASDETTCDLYDDTTLSASSPFLGKVPCAIIPLCLNPGMPCVCNSTGCTAGTPQDAPEGSAGAEIVTFDIALAGDSGDGSVVLPDGKYNVRLVRASH